MLKGWLAGSLFADVPQKGVNNQMEVNDRPIQSGGDDENTTKASKADDNTFTMVIYQKLVHFLMSLNSGGTCAHCLCLFFNEHEVRAKTARLIQSCDKNVSYIKTTTFRVFPHILSLCKLGNDQS